jgi:hypothetical protein
LLPWPSRRGLGRGPSPLLAHPPLNFRDVCPAHSPGWGLAALGALAGPKGVGRGAGDRRGTGESGVGRDALRSHARDLLAPTYGWFTEGLRYRRPEGRQDVARRVPLTSPSGCGDRGTPKLLSPADPAARWAGAPGGQAFFAYCANYLIDLDHAVMVDVEASTTVRPAEVTTAKRMIDRIEQRFDLYPERRAGNAYGSAEMLGWLVHERGIKPPCPCSTSPNEPMGFFRARTSPMTTRGTSMSARAARY